MITITNINERVLRDVQFVTISDGFGITEIPNGYFKECHQLEYIKMPDDIYKIGEEAVLACRSLRYIELPEKNLFYRGTLLSWLRKIEIY